MVHQRTISAIGSQINLTTDEQKCSIKLADDEFEQRQNMMKQVLDSLKQTHAYAIRSNNGKNKRNFPLNLIHLSFF